MECHHSYTKEDFCLPAKAKNNPNPQIKLPNLADSKFMYELSERVWNVFERELKTF